MQRVERESQRRRHYPKALGNNARRQALGAGHDQQSKDLQPGFLSQGAKPDDSGFLIHHRGTLKVCVISKYASTSSIQWIFRRLSNFRISQNTQRVSILTALIEKPTRLVYVSSGTHHGVRPRMDDLLWTKRAWSGYSAYAESRLCDVLLAF